MQKFLSYAITAIFVLFALNLVPALAQKPAIDDYEMVLYANSLSFCDDLFVIGDTYTTINPNATMQFTWQGNPQYRYLLIVYPVLDSRAFQLNPKIHWRPIYNMRTATGEALQVGMMGNKAITLAFDANETQAEFNIEGEGVFETILIAFKNDKVVCRGDTRYIIVNPSSNDVPVVLEPTNDAGNPSVTATALTCVSVMPASPYLGVGNVATAPNATGTACDDAIHGNADDNLIDGADGNDTLYGYDGFDTLVGNNGNDVFVASAGSDDYDGGAGRDSIDNTSATSDVIVVTNGSSGMIIGGGETDTYANVETIVLGGGNDEFVIYGAGGSDSLSAFSLNAGGGANTFTFGVASGYWRLAGSGTETLDFTQVTSNISVNMSHTAYQEVYSGLWIQLGSTFENAEGGSGNDIIIGNNASNVIMGGSGNDTLDGGAGADVVYGGSNNSDITTNADGDDSISDTDAGMDTLFGGNYNTASCTDATVCSDGSDTITANNALVFGGNYNVNGGQGNDIGTDSLTTTDGGIDNRLMGGNKNELGGSGTDRNDILTMTNGQGALVGGNENATASGTGNNDGDDTITVQSSNGSVSVFGDNYNTGGMGTGGNDTILDNGNNPTTINGGNDNNLFTGCTQTGCADGSDTIVVNGDGDKTIYGGNRNASGSGDDGGDVITTTTNNPGVQVNIFGGNENGSGTGNDGSDTINTADGDNADVIYGGNNDSGVPSTSTDAPDTFNTDMGDLTIEGSKP